jgi:hypothetical protein
MSVMIDPDRLARIKHLGTGCHDTPDDPDLCLFEAVAYVTRLPHSDHPPCSSTVLCAYGRDLNDRLPDDLR